MTLDLKRVCERSLSRRPSVYHTFRGTHLFAYRSSASDASQLLVSTMDGVLLGQAGNRGQLVDDLVGKSQLTKANRGSYMFTMRKIKHGLAKRVRTPTFLCQLAARQSDGVPRCTAVWS